MYRKKKTTQNIFKIHSKYLSKWRNMLCSWKERLEFFLKKVIVPKLTYRVNVILIKISTEVLWKMTADSDICMEKEKYPRNSSVKRGNLANQTLKLMMKPYYLMLFWNRKGQRIIEQKRAQKDSRTYGNLTNVRGSNADQWGKITLRFNK